MPSLTTAEIGWVRKSGFRRNLPQQLDTLLSNTKSSSNSAGVRAVEQLVEFFMIEIHPRAGQLRTTGAQGQADLEDA